MKVQVYGSTTYRIVTLLVGIPVAIHFSLVFIDTIVASDLVLGHSVIHMPNPPAPYDGYEWLIIASFFLVHSVHVGTGNLKQWLQSK